LHGALLDAELLAEVYMAMTRGQDSLIMDLGQTPQVATQQMSSKSELKLTVLKATDDELAEHEAYVKSLAKVGARAW
jgi:DNA polymerase-3 subunit epsilon